MDLLAEVSFYIVRAFLISCLFDRILKAKEGSRLQRGIGVILIGLWCFGLSVLGVGSIVSGLLAVVAYIIFAVLCFEGSYGDKIISGFTCMVVLMVSSRLAFDIIAPMIYADPSAAVSGVRRYGMLAVSLVICLGLVALLGRAGKSTLSLPFRYQVVLIPLIGCGAIAMDCLMELISSISSDVSPVNATRVAGFICLLLTVILIAMLLLMESLGHAYQQNSELLEKRRMEQHELKEYELIKSSIKALRSYKHDFKNQMLTLQSLLSQKKYEELEAYIKELSGSMIENMWINSGNPALDAVVSAKRMEAEDKGILFHSELYGADCLTLRMSDLTSVLGNLLDNAIEACTKVTDRGETRIDLSIKPKGSMMCIKIKNSSDGIYNRGGRGLLTRKSGADHGIGLERVTEIVEREGGFCRYYPDAECFTAVVMLPGAGCDKGGEPCS